MMTREALNDLFDYEDGNLLWKRSKGRAKKGQVAGETRDGYRRIKVNGIQTHAHRLIWIWHYGPIPSSLVIDHIDRNRANNRIENLRLATKSQNAHNSGLHRDNTSGYRGVSLLKSGKWISQIRVDGVSYYLGTHKTAEAASSRYMEVTSNK